MGKTSRPRLAGPIAGIHNSLAMDSKPLSAPEARFWKPAAGGRALCTLCPRHCRIGEGASGFCFVRQNVGGRLYQTAYGRTSGFAVDPVEKKPLNHFLPGTDILSFGTLGCNLGCRFCQNWDMSKARMDEQRTLHVTPSQVVDLARSEHTPSIAYTYNDPVIWAEFVIDVCREAHAAGLKNVLVTAGYVTEEARPELFEHVDAANVDLKAFTEGFYRKLTLGHLRPVQETLVWLVRHTSVWVEVTTLLIPGLNDGEQEIREECEWIGRELGDGVPLHFTAFHPAYKLLDLPRTPASTLRRAREIAIAAGLKYVYLGNIYDEAGQTTFCHACGATLITRSWHAVTQNRLQGNRCPDCGAEIPGRFESPAPGPTQNRRKLLAWW
jgi:pyruvate formate lyase activating enzyme